MLHHEEKGKGRGRDSIALFDEWHGVDNPSITAFWIELYPN
jgi:hypothetical protein